MQNMFRHIQMPLSASMSTVKLHFLYISKTDITMNVADGIATC